MSRNRDPRAHKAKPDPKSTQMHKPSLDRAPYREEVEQKRDWLLISQLLAELAVVGERPNEREAGKGDKHSGYQRRNNWRGQSSPRVTEGCKANGPEQ